MTITGIRTGKRNTERRIFHKFFYHLSMYSCTADTASGRREQGRQQISLSFLSVMPRDHWFPGRQRYNHMSNTKKCNCYHVRSKHMSQMESLAWLRRKLGMQQLLYESLLWNKSWAHSCWEEPERNHPEGNPPSSEKSGGHPGSKVFGRALSPCSVGSQHEPYFTNYTPSNHRQQNKEQRTFTQQSNCLQLQPFTMKFK